MSLRDEILSLNDKKVESYFVNEWQKEVYLKKLSSKERTEVETKIFNKKESDVIGMVAAYCLCDESGNRLFDPITEVALVSSKSSTALMEIFHAAIRFNKMREEDIEEFKKN